MTSTRPPNIEQLRLLLAQGLIDQATFDAVVQAAQAPKPARSAAPGAVMIDGDNHGPVHAGDVLNVHLAAAREPGASPQALLYGWLARLMLQMDRLPLTAGDQADSAVRLSAVYTALLTDRTEQHRRGARGEAQP